MVWSIRVNGFFDLALFGNFKSFGETNNKKKEIRERGAQMEYFFWRWLVNTLSIFIVVHVVKGIEVSNTWVILVVALVIGIINAFLRPFIILITLPINILTLGLLTFFINGALFYLVSKMVKGFMITDFWTAFWGYILFSIISFLLSLLIVETF
jgi:putative membrane protein